MSFRDFVRGFFATAHLGVVIEGRRSHTLLRAKKKGRVTKEERREFRSFGEEFSVDLKRYMESVQREYRFCYLSTVLSAINQGAISTCNRGEFENFGILLEEVESLCVNEKFSVYGYRDDVAHVQKVFSQTGGVDFVFSPFLLLYYHFKKRFDDKPRLYVLVESGAVSLAVFDAQQLYFGGYYILATNAQMLGIDDEESLEGADEGLEIEDEEGEQEEEYAPDDESLDNDELVSLDEDDALEIDEENDESIGDLEEGDDIEEFEDAHEEEEPESEHEEERIEEDSRSEESIDEFGRGMDILNFIKNGIEEFYKNDLYKSCFIEDVVIADTSGMSDDVKEYIQNTLLLNVEKESIELVDALVGLSEEELGS